MDTIHFQDLSTFDLLVINDLGAKEMVWSQRHIPQMPDVGPNVDLHGLTGGNVDGECRTRHPQHRGLDSVPTG
jgi:hypothetical protein